MKRLTTVLFLACALALAIVRPAEGGQISYTPYVNGQTLTAAALNAPLSTIVGAFNTNIDNTNIGGLGIYASQILPTNTAQATFGGSVQYQFSNNLLINNQLTISGPNTPIGQFKIVDSANGTTSTNTFYLTAYGGSFGTLSFSNGLGNAMMRLNANAGGKGDAIVLGNMQVAGGLAPSVGYVSPGFNLNSGAGVAATVHTSVGQCSFTGTQDCGVTLPLASSFTSQSSFACFASVLPGSPSVVYIVNNTGTSINIHVAANTSAVYPVACVGT